jgi:serine protease Do
MRMDRSPQQRNITMNIKTPLVAALAGAGIAVAGSSAAFSLNPFKKHDSEQQLAQATAPADTSKGTPATVPPAPVPAVATPNYRAIVQQAGPAVVGVTVAGMHKTEGMQGLPPGAEDDPFFQFFRGLPGMQGRQRGGEVPFRGLGSGFIISSDGLVLTNAHVVREAKEVMVKLSDRREYKAKVLGADPATDIAVLRIDAKNLPTVRLGDPTKLEVGDPVLAIGSPFGFEQTATQGIVSAKGRSLPGDAFVPFIQTDAAVNPGNSGGPLFNGSGEVVGINAQIYSQSGGYQGLAFAIPINVALKVKEQIVATGHAQHARMGVTIQDLNQTLASSFGLSKPDGALVASVAPDSPAAAAGLKAGDVVTEANGEPITSSGALSSRIGLMTPGQTVKLKVWRDKEPVDVSVKLVGTEDVTQTANAGNGDAGQGHIGLALRQLTREERSQAKVDHGLVVENVAGPAARAGINEGDVLLAINGKPVNSVADVKKVLDSKPKSVALLVDRNGDRIFVPVNLG